MEKNLNYTLELINCGHGDRDNLIVFSDFNYIT